MATLSFKSNAPRGYDDFRGHQEDAVLAALRGRDVLVLMPTGGGKSLCYALPGLASPSGGLSIVVSPLIALMQDQVAAFQARGLAADFLASSRTEAERRGVYAALRRLHLVFVTPEQLLCTDSFLELLRGLYSSSALQLVAIDECHCISSWGHDFRASYRRLGLVRQELPRLPIMALTATASPRVQADVIQQLRLRQPVVLRASFNRPNIHISIRYIDQRQGGSAGAGFGSGGADPLPELLALLREEQEARSGGRGDGGGSRSGSDGASGPGGEALRGGVLIYCHKRDTADRVAAVLSRQGTPCRAYHAGCSNAARAEVLSDWQQRRLHCVAATVAFGMGVDRPDVRLVVHANLPKSIEGWACGGLGSKAHRVSKIRNRLDRQSMEYLLEQSAREEESKAGGKWRGGGGSLDGRSPQEAFGEVVRLCLSSGCRRAAVLAAFGEAPSPRAPRCCDACDDPAGAAEAARRAAAAGAARRQRFAGGKHRLDFGGGGWGGGGGEEGRAAAAAAVKRARQRGGNVVVALERAEAAQQSKGAGDAKARLLGKLESGASGGATHSARRAAGTEAVTETLRQNVVKQLAAAIAGSALLSVLLGGGQAAGPAAAALERQVFEGATSKAAYQQQATGLLVGLRSARTAGDAPPAMEQLVASAARLSAAGGSEAAAAATGPALGRADHVIGSLGQGQGEAAAAGACREQKEQSVDAALQPEPLSAPALAAQVEAAVRQCAARAGGPGGPAARHAAVQLLARLEAAPVTNALLQATGAGKQVARLQKHACAAVAAAAAACVASWKRAVGGS
eukprot:scaffold9.g3267.t1